MHKIMNSHKVGKKRLGFFLLAGLLLTFALVFLPAVKDGSIAEAEVGQQDGSISGWMWSSNVGWLKIDSGSSNPASVTSDGTWKGYAWSPSLGWLRFDPVVATGDTYPSTPNHGVKTEGGDVTGWARFCNVYQSPSLCSGSLKLINGPELGGWDGWVKMVNVKKDLATGGLSGYSWGSLNLGWMSLGTHNSNPPATCPVTETASGCCPAWQTCEGTGGPTRSVSCHVSPASAPVGSIFRWYVDPSTDITGLNGGTSSYTYEWFGDAISSPASSGESSEVSYLEAGPKIGYVKVTDTNSNQATSGNCLTSTGGLPNVCVSDGGTIDAVNQVCCSSPTIPRTVGDICEPPPTACTITMSEDDDYGITLHFSPSTPTYNVNETTYFSSQTNQKVTLSNGCSRKDIIATGLPGDVGLVCSLTGGDLNWVPCSNLSGGDYWVGVYSSVKPNPPICRDISLIVGDSNTGTRACFTGSIIN